LALRQALALLPAQVPQHLARLLHQPERGQLLRSAPEYFRQLAYRLASEPPLASLSQRLRRSGPLPASVRLLALAPILRCELRRLLPLGLPPQSVNPQLLRKARRPARHRRLRWRVSLAPQAGLVLLPPLVPVRLLVSVSLPAHPVPPLILQFLRSAPGPGLALLQA
jgi:hypothetical protein